MNNFIKNTLLFCSILLILIIIGAIIPATPRTSKSLLFSKIQKDSLLKFVASPRIIFIGGSNLTFGLNSQMIKDSLNLNPVNTGVHANIGLIYMMDNTLDLIRPNDIVVVAPEYDQFYDRLAYGKEELLRTVLDVSPSSLKKLRREQLINIYSYLPKYSFSKLQPSEYLTSIENSVYAASAFNQYGDVDAHWKLKQQKFAPFTALEVSYNAKIIEELRKYQAKLKERGARMYVTFPGFQATSFKNWKNQIIKIETELKNTDLLTLGTPERYKIPDSLMFNTPYHLNHQGVIYRTLLLIEDIKKTHPAFEYND